MPNPAREAGFFTLQTKKNRPATGQDGSGIYMDVGCYLVSQPPFFTVAMAKGEIQNNANM